MLFQELPLIEDVDNSELLVYSNGVVSRGPNPYTEFVDQQIINLVLSRFQANTLLFNHIGNPSIHLPKDDESVSNSSTWSSNKINSEIAESTSWLTLDNIPEGDNNLYFTEERGRQAVLDAAVGVSSVDHNAIAAAIVSMWQGWSTQEFTYYLERDSQSPTSITIDGVTTVDQFTVTPGPHTVSAEYTRSWVCPSLGHLVTIISGESSVITITPLLSLDAIQEGVTNKIWNPDELTNHPIMADLQEHYNTNYNLYHVPPINDASNGLTTTWSSNKIIQYVNTQRASIAPSTETKEFGVFTERANSGLRPTGYTWQTVNNGNGTYTHRIARIFNNDDYRSSIPSPTSDYYFNLPDTGNWLVYWIANTTINPYFTNVTNIKTYLGEHATFSNVRLQYPSVINKNWATTPYLSLITEFTCNQAYNATYRDTWLMPKSIPGRFEVYSQIHFEKIT